MGSDDKVNDSSDNHPLTSSNQQTIVFNEHLHTDATTFACNFADLLFFECVFVMIQVAILLQKLKLPMDNPKIFLC